MKNNLAIVQTVVTADGSVTLFRPDLDETYHSRHGAIQESMHVFIESGLNYVKHTFPSPLKILEIGFGTGLNALLTARESKKNKLAIEYCSLEKFPVSVETYQQLNYSSLTNEELIWDKIINATWNIEYRINDYFLLHKLEEDISLFETKKTVNIIYYDAFAPRVQPELWSTAIFSKLFLMLESKGVLVTYCASGQVKRNLKEAGFIVQAIPGPPGKREMTRAIKP